MSIADRRAREFQRREDEILSAAVALAGSEDWAAITIDDIAERAEIGKGTVYKHFRSKDEVCARLVMDDGRRLLGKLAAVDPTLEFVPRIRAVLRTFWQHALERPELRSLAQYCELSENSLNLSPDLAERFWAVRNEIIGRIRVLLEEGIRLGIIADQPIPYLIAAGWSTIAGAKRLVLESDGFPELAHDEAFLDYLIDYVLKGLMNAQVPMREAVRPS